MLQGRLGCSRLLREHCPDFLDNLTFLEVGYSKQNEGDGKFRENWRCGAMQRWMDSAGPDPTSHSEIQKTTGAGALSFLSFKQAISCLTNVEPEKLSYMILTLRQGIPGMSYLTENIPMSHQTIHSYQYW